MEAFQPGLIRHEIGLQMDYDTLLNYCQVSRQARELCHDRYFWQEKSKLEFGTSSQDFSDTFLPPMQRYLQLLVKHGGIAKGAEQFLSPYTFLQRAIQLGRDDLVDYIIQKGYSDPEDLCYFYAESGRLDKLKQMSCWDYPHILYQLPSLDNLEIVRYLLSEQSLSSFTDEDITDLIAKASSSKNLEIVQYLVSFFADRLQEADWNEIMKHALIGGSIPIYQYLLTVILGDYSIDWNNIYYRAFSSGNEIFINYLLEELPFITRDPFHELESAVRSGNLDLVKKVASDNNYDLRQVSSRIPLGFMNLPIIRYLISLKAFSTRRYYAGLKREFNEKELEEYLQLIPDEVFSQWSIYDYRMILHNPLTPFFLPLFLKRLDQAKYAPPLDWNRVIRRILFHQEKQDLDRVFRLAGNYSFDWEQIMDQAKKIRNPYLIQYLKKIRH